MTAQIFDFQKIKNDCSADNLDIHVDDFSIRVTSRTDRLFWVRVVETEEGDVLVTDFNPGQLSQVALNIGLRKALGELFAQRPKSLRFKNIIPSGQTSVSQDRLNTIMTACKSATLHTQQAIRAFNVVRDGSKIDVLVALGSEPIN